MSVEQPQTGKPAQSALRPRSRARDVIAVAAVAGFLVPVPILLLHVVEALVQAYIFGMLALVYIASGIQAQKLPRETTETST